MLKNYSPMSSALRIVLALLACGIALPAMAGVTTPPTIPSRITAEYDVYKDSIKGATIVETFTYSNGSYRIESVSKAAGIISLLKPETITVVSRGKLTAQGLQPQSYTLARKLDTDRNVRAALDWDKQRVTLHDSNGERTQPLPADTQDRLSAMYQFMFLPLQKASTLDFHMTNGNKVDIYNYLLTSGPSVTVPLGTFKTTYAASVSKSGETRTEIWLATERLNFPCKMVITNPDGGKLTQVLTRFDVKP